MRDKLKSYFLNLNYTQLLQLLMQYMGYLRTDRVNWNLSNIGSVQSKKGLMIFVVRFNNRIDFNDNKRNNDLMIAVEYISKDNYNIFTFEVTADPKSKVYNIAHLSEQVYTGNIRNHRWIAGRIAICSDNGKGTWIKRTDSKGNVVKDTIGHFGINIHDTGGFWNSSLGCIILSNDSEYKTVFKPLLQRVSNKNNIPVCVMNYDYFTEELNII